MKRFISLLLIELVKPSYIPCNLRNRVLKFAGVSISPSAVVCSGVDIKNTNIVLESNVLIKKNVHLYTVGHKNSDDWIYIGENTQCAFDVKITTATHLIGEPQKRSGKPYSKPVRIGKGCWIGIGAIILPGVTIGDGCVVAGGAVVNKDCEPNGLYAGVPAKLIRKL